MARQSLAPCLQHKEDVDNRASGEVLLLLLIAFAKKNSRGRHHPAWQSHHMEHKRSY